VIQKQALRMFALIPPELLWLAVGFALLVAGMLAALAE
jgi:hypothetical protein